MDSQMASTLTSSSSLIMSSASNTDEIHSWNLRRKYVKGFLQTLGAFKDLPETHQKKGFVSDMMRNLLKIDRIERGRIICHLTVKRLFTNAYGTFHGGTVAGVAELVAMACARTVVEEDRELFLGEMSMSYLSGSAINFGRWAILPENWKSGYITELGGDIGPCSHLSLNGIDDGYFLRELPGDKPDPFEGAQWDGLGFFLQYQWAFGVVFALIALGVAVATYNEGATDFKQTTVYRESIQSQELLEGPEASNSDVFEGNPTEEAPSLE